MHIISWMKKPINWFIHNFDEPQLIIIKIRSINFIQYDQKQIVKWPHFILK